MGVPPPKGQRGLLVSAAAAACSNPDGGGGSSVACSHTHACMLVSRHSLSSAHMCCCVAWHHTPLPCRWKKQGHWCVEKNRGEGGVKKRCCPAHHRDSWHWLCPRCQQASGKWAAVVVVVCYGSAQQLQRRVLTDMRKGGGVGGRGGVLLCDRVLFRCCCQHPCYPCA